MNRVACLFCILLSYAASCLATEPPITALAFTLDGKSLIACSQSGVQNYSWPELNPRNKLNSAIENPHDICFSPSGRRIAIAGGRPAESGMVEILAWPSGASLATLDQHIDSAMAVSWVRESSIAIASLDQDVRVWDIDSESSSLRLSGHSRGVTSLCYLGHDDFLVSSGIDQSLRVWNIKTGELLNSLSIHTQRVHDLELRPGDHRLSFIASASDDKTVRFWQPTIGRMVRFVRLSSEPLDVEWLPDGSAIAASCVDGHVRVINPDTVEVVHDIGALDEWGYSLAAHPTDGSLAVGGADGSIRRVVIPRHTR